MIFRTLALALVLSCGLTAVGEAKQKTAVSRKYKAPKIPKAKGKPGKMTRYKPGKYKPHKQVVKKQVVKK